MAKQSAWNRFFARHRKNNKFTPKQISNMWKAKKKGKKISNMYKSKNKKSRAVKSTSRRRKMARGNGSSYSKTNIALGTLLSQVAPKFAPGARPKPPTFAANASEIKSPFRFMVAITS